MPRMFFVVPDQEWATIPLVELRRLGLFEQPNLLVSYFYFPTLEHLKRLKAALPPYAEPTWFLDSGAFSAWTTETSLRLSDYLAWLKGAFDILGRDRIYAYANLDVVRNPALTWRNQRVIERSGFRPLPVIHSNASPETVEQVVEEYDTFAVGGLVGGGSNSTHYEEFLAGVFDKATTRHGIHTIHGFGVTSYPIMRRFPFSSVDSSSWMAGARWGRFRLFDPRTCTHIEVDMISKRGSYVKAIELLSACYPYSMKELKELRHARSRQWRAAIGTLSILSYRYIVERVRRHQNET